MIKTGFFPEEVVKLKGFLKDKDRPSNEDLAAHFSVPLENLEAMIKSLESPKKGLKSKE